MATTDSGVYVSVDTTIGGQGPNPTTAKLPDATASFANFQSLSNMSGAGVIGIEIDKVQYGIPMVSL